MSHPDFGHWEWGGTEGEHGNSKVAKMPPTHDVHVDNHIHLDGREIHHSVVRRMIQAGKHPSSAPYHNGRRAWTPPDSQLVGV
jgi:hypothetical protein